MVLDLQDRTCLLCSITDTRSKYMNMCTKNTCVTGPITFILAVQEIKKHIHKSMMYSKQIRNTMKIALQTLAVFQ